MNVLLAVHFLRETLIGVTQLTIGTFKHIQAEDNYKFHQIIFKRTLQFSNLVNNKPLPFWVPAEPCVMCGLISQGKCYINNSITFFHYFCLLSGFLIPGGLLCFH